MRLKIQGSPTLEDIQKALADTLKAVGFDPGRHTLKGVNIYMNIYDREAGENVTFVRDGEEMDAFLWMTPAESEKYQARLEKERLANQRAQERAIAALAAKEKARSSRAKTAKKTPQDGQEAS